MDQSAQIPQIFDTIIIGGGPAGISAAIYAVRKNLKVLLITKNIGGQAALSGDIENYLGFSLITGAELAQKFRDEVKKFENNGLWVKEGEEVVTLSGQDPNFMVTTAQGGEYHGKTILIASGRVPRLLNVPGEREFLGKGVATCATCDAPLFKNKDVAVVGGGNSALDAAFSLMKIASSVTIINLTPDVKGDEILIRNVKGSPIVKILNTHQVLEIQGDQFVNGIKIQDLNTKEGQILPVSGVFIEIGWIPSTGFDQLTHKNSIGEIMVDEFGETSVPGIYSAGDVNDLWGEQIVIAAGEGAKVALKVAEHLAKTPHNIISNSHEQA
jgi:NADH-dependent peroxiredoxin subunit F